MALYGLATGFVSAGLSLGGFAAGAWLGTRLGPKLLADGPESPYAPLFGLLGALVAGAVLAAGFETVGVRLRGRLRSRGAMRLDEAAGALLAACLGLGLAWLFGAIALHTPGARELRREVQRSAILSRLNDVFPPSGPLLNTLARFDPFPRVDGPSADVPAPTAEIARDPQVRAAAASVVKVIGTACGLGVSGSGWVARGGLVVTNAHVVAGQDDTEVLLRGEGPALRAVAVRFDARNDVAILRVEGLAAPALPLASSPAAGTAAAILGFPENGPYDVRAGRLGRTSQVLTADAYGNGPIPRRIAALRGTVRSGNSGGPMVDGSGRVVTTVFAATTSGRRGGYGVPNDIVSEALRKARGPVSTGSCAP